MTLTVQDCLPEEQQALGRAYFDAALAYVRTGQEVELSCAYDIARAALTHDVSIVTLCSLHGRVVRDLAAQAPRDPLPCRLEQFFLEAVSVYDMAQNGYREAVEGMKQEVTERRKIEEELRDATFELVRQRDDLDQLVTARTAEIQQALDALNAVNLQLRHANEEQSEFTHALSHDLKSPLNTIAMMLDILETDLLGIDDDARLVLHAARDTARRMLCMIDDILRYAKTIEEPKRRDPVELDGLIDGIISDLQGEIRAAGARVDRGALPIVSGDAMQLRLLFQNLISNAIKFRSPHRAPEVRIERTDHTPGEHHVRVSDNGIGIDAKYHERIFGLFQRLHFHDEYPGTGLGLTLCKRIAGNHSGQIVVESELGQGSSFTVALRGCKDGTGSVAEPGRPD